MNIFLNIFYLYEQLNNGFCRAEENRINDFADVFSGPVALVRTFNDCRAISDDSRFDVNTLKFTKKIVLQYP